MRNLILSGLFIILAAGLGLFLIYSQKSVEQEIISAVTRSDVNALAERIDFDQLRTFLKQDLLAKKNDKSPAGALFAGGGPAADKIPEVVDYYIQPENIGILYYFRDMSFKEIPVENFIVSRGFSPLYGFTITLGLRAEDAKDPSVRAALDRIKVKLVFRLSGTTWKMTEMHVPLFMVPKFTYSTPAIKVFGPR